MASRIIPSFTFPGAQVRRGTPPGTVPPTASATPAGATPVLLSDVITVQSGGEQTFRSEAFTNTRRRPIDLHALRISIDLGRNLGTFRALGGGLIGLQISVDGHPLTRGYVPVWALVKSDNRRADSFAVTSGLTNYVWRFTHPLRVAPGRRLTVQVQHFGVLTTSATVYVSFAGAEAGNTAIVRRVPYALYWRSRAFGYAEAGVDTAPPAALLNDLKKTLHVDRVIGRFAAYYDDGAGAPRGFEDYDDDSNQGLLSASIRLGLAQNRPILKDFAPWRAVFGQNAALETDFTLAPGEYVTCDVKHAAGPVLGTPFTFFQGQGFVSLVGWREV